ncbi:MAG TPA: LacI family transcriptional regulator, partial [Ruminococcaceae bacterium]|nr:LacI family transcriptional regulator [Oscillospiraceae bacterium]
MQGEMIGKYLVENYDKLDLNGDGKISYVMFKGQEGNME